MYQLSLQLKLEWIDNLNFTPSDINLYCFADTTSPPPSLVTNFTAVSVTIHGINDIEVGLEWTPPANANGILQKYMICIHTTTVVPEVEQAQSCDEVLTVRIKFCL